MPTLMELRNRLGASPALDSVANETADECMIQDRRAGLSPAQFVEQKLRSVLPLRVARPAVPDAQTAGDL